MFSPWLCRLREILSGRRPTARRPRPLVLETLEGRVVPTIVYGLTGSNTLVRFDSSVPALVNTITITGLQTNSEDVLGIDYRPRTGQLFATTAPVGVAANALVRTYAIDPLSGAATFVGSIPAGTVPGAGDVTTGYDFNPTVDRIRVVNANNENFRINPNNGSLAGDDPNLTFTAPATGPVIEEAYDRNFDRPNATLVKTTLYGIDLGTSRLVVQGGIDGAGPGGANGGVITSVGPLGVTLDAGSMAGFDIAAGTQNGGLGLALAALKVGGTTGLYSINLTTGAATLVGTIGAGSTTVRGLAIVPDSVVVVGSGAGASGDVRILSATTGALRVAITPFASYAGGVRVAAGDVTGDGIPDAVVSAVAPQGHVKVFDGVTGAERYSFFAFEGFQGTVNVASGDVNGDGFDDVIVVANGVNGHVKAFSGRDGSLIASFLAYDGFTGNVTVASADFNLDGTAEIVTAAAFNGHVKVFNADGTSFSSTGFNSSFLSFDGYLGDVFVTAGDVNGDGRADVIVASGAGTLGHVKAFSGTNSAQIANFFATGVTLAVGPPVQISNVASVGVADTNADGRYEIVVTPSGNRQAKVVSYDVNGNQVASFDVFAGFQGSVTVAGQRF